MKPSGPISARIALVGEAPGENEEILEQPFVGAAGQELTNMLAEAGIDRSECFITNVFSRRPPDNKLDAWCASRKEVGKDYPYPALSPGKYIIPEYLELDRLEEELLGLPDLNLVVALGSTASWALLRDPRITKARGVISPGVLTNHKVLPTYHPAAVLRQWNYRVVVIADFMKAARERQFREIRRPQRHIWTEPNLHAIEEFFNAYIANAKLIAWDIETSRGQIDCIGFSPDPHHALVIPFTTRTGSYWETPHDE